MACGKLFNFEKSADIHCRYGRVPGACEQSAGRPSQPHQRQYSQGREARCKYLIIEETTHTGVAYLRRDTVIVNSRLDQACDARALPAGEQRRSLLLR